MLQLLGGKRVMIENVTGIHCGKTTPRPNYNQSFYFLCPRASISFYLEPRGSRQRTLYNIIYYEVVSCMFGLES